jgi:ABC-type proline/glycine betaine transport system substrate-binding protein
MLVSSMEFDIDPGGNRSLKAACTHLRNGTTKSRTLKELFSNSNLGTRQEILISDRIEYQNKICNAENRKQFTGLIWNINQEWECNVMLTAQCQPV